MSYQPKLTENAVAYHARMLPGYKGPLFSTDPEFAERFANFAFDEVIAATPELDDRTRFMCWLATLLGCQGIDEFRVMLRAALNMGLEPLAIREIVYQAQDYLGMGRVYPFLLAMGEGLRGMRVKVSRGAGDIILLDRSARSFYESVSRVFYGNTKR